MTRITDLAAVLDQDATLPARIAALVTKLLELAGGPTGITDTGLGVSEDAANGATAGTFLIEGGTAPYTITITEDLNSIWRIADSGVSADGVVEVEVEDNTNLAGVGNTALEFVIKITDDSGLIYDDVLVEIPVTAVIPSEPDPITGITLSANEVADDATNGTAIGTASMVGGEGAASAWALTDDNDGMFAIHATTGAITVLDNTGLSALADTTVNITVQVTDSHTTPQTASFQATIHVTGTPEEPPPGDTPEVVDTVQYTSTATKTDHTIPAVPTGTGGLLSLLIATDKGRGIPTPAGWTEVYNILVEDGSEGTTYSCRAARFVKVDAGETTVDFVIGTGDGHCSAILSRLTDVDHADIVNAISGTPLRTTGVTEAACPSVTTDEADTLVFCDCITGHKRAITLPAGLTAIANIEDGGGVSLASVTKEKGTAGATTAETFSWTNGAPVIAIQTAINFGVGGGDPPPDPEPDPGTTVNAASGSAADIQAAVDAASPGDTVLIPNSTGETGGAWAFGNGQVTVDKALTIKGNGRNVCAIQRLHAGPTRMFEAQADDIEFSNFEIRGTAWDSGGTDYAITYRGGRFNQQVHDMRLTKLAYGIQSLGAGNAPVRNPTGDVYSNEFIQLGSANNTGRGYGWNIIGPADTAWTDAANNGLGLDDLFNNTLFFEDNTCQEVRHPCVGENGSRVVQRDNSAIDCSRKSASVGLYDVHGKTKSWPRGGLVTILVRNTVGGIYPPTGGNVFAGFQARGGFIACHDLDDITGTTNAVVGLMADDDDFMGDPYDGFFWNNKREGVLVTEVFDGSGGGQKEYRRFGGATNNILGTDVHVSANANPPGALATFLQSGTHGVTTWAEIQTQLDAAHPLRA